MPEKPMDPKQMLKDTLNNGFKDGARVILFSIGFLVLNLSFVVFSALGYLSLPGLILTWFLVILSTVFLVLSVYGLHFWLRYTTASGMKADGEVVPIAKKHWPLPFIIPVIISAAIFIGMYFLEGYLRWPGTDEINIDYYAGYLILHGLNPYFSANMQNVFAFMAFPLSGTTPLLTGGYVTSFSYPSLAALIFVPAVALNIQPMLIPLFFSVGDFIVIYLYPGNTENPASRALIAVLVALTLYYSLMAIGGAVDSIWIFFILLSFTTRKKPALSGIFFGLSIALKQLPLLLFPFFLILIYMESEKRLKNPAVFLLGTAGAFILPNLPFILVSPLSWFKGVTSILTTPLLGVGFGPSALEFVGYLRISPTYFTFVMVIMFVFLVAIYIIHYEILKFAFFVFPILILLLNFRVETDYLNVWPLFLLPVIAEIFKGKSAGTNTAAVRTPKRKVATRRIPQVHVKATVTILLILILVTTMGFAGYHFSSIQPASNAIDIISIENHTSLNSKGNFVSSITLTINYHPEANMNQSIPALFAIFVSNNQASLLSGNFNPLLWYGTPDLSTGTNTVIIKPEYSSELLPSNTTFEIMEYYGHSSAYLKSTGLT
ncbi:MAG: hypothetical protein B2I17_07265 [Thermoplasmatales archaeon B_DKE]|nr:MAG: hypothetical protein B2I17_07265 [Thermoplasmatales archaeon B_DKE]